MYQIIDNQTNEVVLSTANESEVELFFSIEDIELYSVEYK
jgi:hypothetical protein